MTDLLHRCFKTKIESYSKDKNEIDTLKKYFSNELQECFLRCKYYFSYFRITNIVTMITAHRFSHPPQNVIRGNFSMDTHCVKSVRIRSFSGPYSDRMRENANQKNSEYGHFSVSG